MEEVLIKKVEEKAKKTKKEGMKRKRGHVTYEKRQTIGRSCKDGEMKRGERNK